MKMRGTPVLFYQSLNRQFLVLGVERSLFFLLLPLSLSLPFSAHFALRMDLIAIALFLFLHVIGILITRADPNMIDVFKRHIHYRKYYDPIAGVHAQIKIIKPSVPYYVGKRGLV
jgi:type IV secretory pathway TrbD component